jgi:hypothetical protein
MAFELWLQSDGYIREYNRLLQKHPFEWTSLDRIL